MMSYLSSVASTSEPHTERNLQLSDAFSSTKTTLSEDPTPCSLPGYHKIEWQRLYGYEIPTKLKKKGTRISWIYRHGWRIHNLDNSTDHWLCYYCHLDLPKPLTPRGHVFNAQSTTGASNHLLSRHSIIEAGRTSRPMRTPAPLGQPTIDGFTAASAERNRARSGFDLNTFLALLLRFFVIEAIPLVKVESSALRDLLCYCEPRLEGNLPSRRSLTRYLGQAYDSKLAVVANKLAHASTKINLSFDIWTTPSHKLSLLGTVAHFLDEACSPRSVLLALPRMRGSHSGLNISMQLAELLDHFKIKDRFGQGITDNASENYTCMELLTTKLFLNAKESHVLCAGHIINLIAEQVLWGSSKDAFETELTNITAEEVELQSWRNRGPMGKLHNVIKYICYSSSRRERFEEMQRELLENGIRPEGKREVYELVKDNRTRWNSFYDAATRALYLQAAITEFCEKETSDYDNRVQRESYKPLHQQRVLKAPSIHQDKLGADDWAVIAEYVAILKPLKDGTMLLQGRIADDKDKLQDSKVPTRGAIWQVRPVFESILSTLEEARTRYLPREAIESQQTQRSRSQHKHRRVAKAHKTTAFQPIAPIPQYLATEHHFSTNINLGWQKGVDYYEKLDLNPVYDAAVVFHPRLKWRWFNASWKDHPEWVAKAQEKILKLWHQYKDKLVTTPLTSKAVEQSLLQQRTDQWSQYDNDQQAKDQYNQYLSEPYPITPLTIDSPIPYWTAKRSVWPQLAQLALDVFSVPPMSDELERVFSEGSSVLVPRRRLLSSDVMQWLLCLKNWERSGIVELDKTLFETAVGAVTEPVTIDVDSDSDNHLNSELTSTEFNDEEDLYSITDQEDGGDGGGDIAPYNSIDVQL
jgi:hypothetical protein